MNDDHSDVWQFPLPLSMGTSLVFVFVGPGYFVFLAWLVSSDADDPFGAARSTVIHGALYSAVMAWIWLPRNAGTSVRGMQLTLPGIFGVITLVAISISFASQALAVQAWLGPVSRRHDAGPIAFYSLLYFIFSVPFAMMLAMGALRLGQILNRRRR